MKAITILVIALLGFLATVTWYGVSVWGTVVLFLSILYLLQGVMTVVAMLNSWVTPRRTYNARPPKESRANKRATFSLIIPCRHEAGVIGETLAAMTRIDYPKNLYEVIVSVRTDDKETLKAIREAEEKLWREAIMKKQKPTQIKLATFSEGPLRKPRNLNVALEHAQYGFVGVFDAEDEPNPAILKKVEATFQRKGVDVVQGGVQLINVSSRWFTIINCLEYYFWFKSVLPFMAELGATPVGGNTIFIRSAVLRRVGGWDESALTEDADIGIRLSSLGYKIGTIYDEEISTLEEAPVTTNGFIKQRTRWDQGYIQVLLKGDWMKLPTLRNQFLTMYMLIHPILQMIFALGILAMPLFMLFISVEIPIAIFSFLPLYFLILQLGIYTVGLRLLTRQYRIKISPWVYVGVWLTYFPYNVVLGMATISAISRNIQGSLEWDKTNHINAHREELGLLEAGGVV